ncbi:MAG: hypothetical protein AAF617_09940 [Bacteroidota bacterium]
MKKQHFKNLQLNKRTITDLQHIDNIRGGGGEIEESIICGTFGISCTLFTNPKQTCTVYTGKCISNNNEATCDATIA